MKYRSKLTKCCSNCEWCAIHDYGYGTEMYCDCSSSENNNGYDVIDDTAKMTDCVFFRNKHIKNNNGVYQIEQLLPINDYIKYESNNFDILNSSISERTMLHYQIRTLQKKKNDEIKELKEFIDFFRQELPEIYSRLKRNYKERNNKNE